MVRDLVTLQGIVWRSRPWCGPRVAQINISEDCNLDCAICNRSSMGVSGLLPFEQVKALADELDGLGTQEIFLHGFGEPGCHPRLPDMIDYIGEKHCRIRQHLITNGSWSFPRLRETIVSRGVHTRFSLHAADRETWQRLHPHDDIRSFDQANENLAFIAAQAPELAEVLFVICSLNIGKIAEMTAFALDHGVQNILFRPMRLFKDRQGKYMNAALQPTAKEYREAAATIVGLKRAQRGNISIQSIPFDQTLYDSKLGRPSSRSFYLKRSCYIGYVLTVIERDGSVWGCLPESSGGRPMGNIAETSFRDIWYGPNYERFRKQMLFSDKAALDHHGCHSYCQHLETNTRLNRLTAWRFLLNRRHPGASS
jgi:MoaA/NifB/PqqE/SkfB family radical SAM enzyme